jgi:phage FluMu protein Com
MNLRCIYCQTPFTLARNEMLGAIITMNEKHQSHYDAHCPRCRRANSISRQRMELFFPNWQDAAKQLASAPPPAPKAETPASAMAKTEPLPKAAKATAEKKTAVKKPAEKAATKKPAATKASAAKKPAAKNGAEPKPKKK